MIYKSHFLTCWSSVYFSCQSAAYFALFSISKQGKENKLDSLYVYNIWQKDGSNGFIVAIITLSLKFIDYGGLMKNIVVPRKYIFPKFTINNFKREVRLVLSMFC